MADCSKTEEFLSEARRMCQNTICKKCPLDEICDDIIQFSCKGFDIVQKWSDEHPLPKPKTYAAVFFEKFPNAPKDENGLPKPYLCDVYASKSFECFGCAVEDGKKCWLEPYEQDDEEEL